MLILADALVSAPDRILRPGHLRVSGRKIREIGTDLQAEAGEEVLELPGLTLAPGFINLHAHLELASLHGRIRPGQPFTDWLRQLLVLLPGLHSTARTASIVESSRRAAETGTTTILTIVSDPGSLAGLAGTWPRIWWALEFMDLDEDPQPARQMDRMTAWVSRHNGAEWNSAVSPHAPFTASSGLYRECARLAWELHIPFTTHWAESPEEKDLFDSGKGTLRSLLPKSWMAGQLSERLESFPPSSLVAHANHLRMEELSRFKKSGCFVIHCPATHRWFDREPFSLEKMLQHGIPVILGTDSPASSDNRHFDLRVEAREFRRTHPSVSPPEIWAMLTTLPARALGQAGRLGCLQAEAEADWVGWRLEASTEPVCAILESSEPAEIVSVAGRIYRPERI